MQINSFITGIRPYAVVVVECAGRGFGDTERGVEEGPRGTCGDTRDSVEVTKHLASSLQRQC